MKHMQNVRSVEDVLSNLSAQQKGSPKFSLQQKAIRILKENESHPVLSIDSYGKFDQAGLASSSKEESLTLASAAKDDSAYGVAGGTSQAKKRAHSALQL